MLLNDFFTINNIQKGEINTINISLNSNHKTYEGHFPGNPVVPGVCLSQMVKETMEQIVNQKLTMVTGDNIKFTAVLNPQINTNVSMTLSIKTKENGLLQADSKIFSGETSFFSF